MLVVTINGTDYYSDLTGVETGVYPVLMSSIPKEYTLQGDLSGSLLTAAEGAGEVTDGNSYDINQLDAHSRGNTYVSSVDGGHEIPESVAAQIEQAILRSDWDTANKLMAQYN